MVTLVTPQDRFAEALTRLLGNRAGASTVQVLSTVSDLERRIADEDSDDGARRDGLALRVPPDRDRKGVLEGFYLLRPLLMGTPRPFLGPVGLVGLERRLFAKDDAVIPEGELVCVFGHPLDVEGFVSHVLSGRIVESRPFTRSFLRGRLVAEDIRLIAGGDHHALRQFEALQLQVQILLNDSGRRQVRVAEGTALRGIRHTSQALAAEGILDSAADWVRDGGGDRIAEGALHRLRVLHTRLATVARHLDRVEAADAADQATAGEAARAVSSLVPGPITALVQAWYGDWKLVCNRLLPRLGSGDSTSSPSG